jgi:phosphatidylglycerophosphatase A
MDIKSFCAHIATLGPLGYLVAPGTVATLVTMPFMYLVHTYTTHWQYLILLIVAAIVAVYIINRALEFFKDFQDPSQVVLDEVIGCFVTFYAIPLTWYSMLAGFLLFRFFDITKWFGIAKAERLVGAWGVLMDDVLAGLLANAILQISCHFIFGT